MTAHTEVAPGQVVLSGLTGSRAHGTAHEHSDYDYKGFYLAPTASLVGIYPPLMEKLTTHIAEIEEIEDRKVGVTYHEMAKGLHLLIRSNPDVLEILWLSEYDVLSPIGEELIEMRLCFPSQRAVREAYLGYADRQLGLLIRHGRLGNGMDKRMPKHARHLKRLLEDGYRLYTEGRLSVQVEDPYALFEFGEQCATDPEFTAAKKMLREYEDKFDSAASILREEPDRVAAEDFLLRIRKTYWKDTA